ncbi:MAG TPA: YlxR family protein [bacterium]|nr:YlxR family protein [bacterium]
MPIRTCVACRQRREKSRLLRWIEDERGNPVPDPAARLPGRGAYVCPTQECVDRLGRRFRKRGRGKEDCLTAFRLAIQGGVPQNVAGETHEN